MPTRRGESNRRCKVHSSRIELRLGSIGACSCNSLAFMGPLWFSIDSHRLTLEKTSSMHQASRPCTYVQLFVLEGNRLSRLEEAFYSAGLYGSAEHNDTLSQTQGMQRHYLISVTFTVVGQCGVYEHVVVLLDIMFYVVVNCPCSLRGPSNTLEAAVSKLKIRELSSCGG